MTQVEILVLDFGSQYTQLIARRLREYGVYTEIVPYFEKLDSIQSKNPKGLILSGGPASVYEEGAYKPDSRIFELGIPVLGICYGMQYIADFFGGKVVRAEAQEFGKAVLEIIESTRHCEQKDSARHSESSCHSEAKAEESINKESMDSKDISLPLNMTDSRYREIDSHKILESKRTILRKFTQDDFEALHRILSDENVMQAWGHGFSKKESQDWLDLQLRRYDSEGIGSFAVIDKQSGELIASAGLNYENISLNGKDKQRIVELGYILRRDFWHKGYASEVAQALINYAFYTLKLKDIYALIKDDNFSSMKVARGLGMRIIGENIKNYKGEDLNHYIFNLKHSELVFYKKALHYSIQRANKEDLSEILALQYEAFESEVESYGTREIPALLDNLEKSKASFNETIILKCVSCEETTKGQIIGAVRARYKNDGTSLIGPLCVKPAMQGMGIAKALMSEIESEAKSYRYELWTNPHNAKNIAMYERMGYKHYKDDYVLAHLKVAFFEKFADSKSSETRIESKKAESNRHCEQSEAISSHYTINKVCHDLQSKSRNDNALFNNVKQDSIVWMSHADKVEKIPSGFVELAKSGNTHYCAIADFKRKVYALQFHPEVVHSECGGQILKNFAINICGCDTSWNMHNFIESEIAKIRKIVGMNESEYERLDSLLQTNRESRNVTDIKSNVVRCGWAGSEKIYQDYHDNEWGVPLHDEYKLFEFLVLESMQAGLSWITILKKREAFREAFDNFNPHKVAKYDNAKIESLLQNEGIIRNKAKIESAINNAQKFLEIEREFGSFDSYIWEYVKNKPIINDRKDISEIPAFSSLSTQISKDLQQRGFKFVGSTTIYAFMQAIGMVNDHINECICKNGVNAESKGKNKAKLDSATIDSNTLESTAQSIQAQTTNSDSKVLCAVSGGVDSSVVATLLYRAIGERLIPVFVDTGLLRLGEREAVEKMFRENLGVPLITIDASETFLGRLSGVVEPERKRKIIGETFIEVFEEEARKHNAHGEIKFLAQGTLYPDVIESVSIKGPSKTIKSHHNVGGLPEWMKFELIEPLRELFKDEVRNLGRELGMPESMLMRHPFPGPGLAIRIMGEVNKADLEILKRADSIFIEELRNKGLYDSVWQAFCVLLNVKSVGVMGDNRTYDNTICVRAVEAIDGMTATFAHLPHDFLENVANRIINEVEGINRVVYDITSKPPGTIEWE